MKFTIICSFSSLLDQKIDVDMLWIVEFEFWQLEKHWKNAEEILNRM